MRIRILTFILIISSLVAHAEQTKSADILVYTRTETQWNIFLMKEFRQFMNNLALGIDPYQYQHGADIIYGEDNIDHYISEEAHRLMDAISTGSGIDMLSTKPELKIHGLEYTVGSITPQIYPEENSEGAVLLKSHIALSDVSAFAREISLTFVLGKDEKGLNLPSPEVKIINPKVILNKGKEVSFGLDVLLKENREAIELNFENGDFNSLTRLMKEDPDLIDIAYDGIEIPAISLQIMGRDISPKKERILQIIEEQKPSLKVILMDQLRVLFEKDGAMEILKHFNGTKLQRNYWIESTKASMFPIFLGVKDITVPMKGVLATELEGDFCTSQNFERNGQDCIEQRLTKTPKSKITKADIAYSQTLIDSTLKSDKDIKFLASLSEDYINKAIVTTIDFGVWQPILDEMDIALGDKGVLVKFDKTGKNASVILDVVYDVGKLPGLVLNQRKLRFPVVLDATIRTEQMSEKDENDLLTGAIVSHIIFNINNVNLNDDILLYGHQDYEFPSTVQNVRKFMGLRKQVIKKIKKELFDFKAPDDPQNFKKWKGVDLPPIALPEIQDMYLEKMELNSDAHGRLNLILRGSETIYRQN